MTRDFGISKMMIRLTKRLAEVLKADIEVLNKAGLPVEFAFIFPYDISVITEPAVEKQEVIIEEPEPVIEEAAAEPEIQPEIVEEPVAPVVVEIEKPVEVVPQETVVVVKNVQQAKDSKYDKHKIDLSKYSCLYIEDQVDSQILLKVQLKDLKDIKFAVSFEEAVPLLTTLKFDFILMDINLQGEYNGLDALKIIHRMPGLETIPIIAVTAYVLPGDKEKFIAAGFIDFCAKPLFREKMVEVLERVFV